MSLADTLGRHERIALQFSGGRDSLACLYLLRPFWDKITVYWCDTGDAFPETRDIVELVRAQVPRFVRIAGRAPQVVEQFGLPSDIVPASHTPLGLIVAGSAGPLIQDRYSCCYRAMMEPTAERMRADGITLIIRGQRQSDRLKSPVRSGHVENGVELLFPIEDWSSQQVMDFLREERAPIPRFYQMLESAPDCMTCSAWWENGVASYLKRHHPAAYRHVQARLDIINAACGGSIAAFNHEVSV